LYFLNANRNKAKTGTTNVKSHKNSLPINNNQRPINASIGLDIDKLSVAVALAETSGCKDGTAKKRKNCHGIMTWNKSGARSPKYFKNFDESYAEFKKIWQKGYKIYPTRSMAIKWTGNDKPCIWLRTVDISYTGQSEQKCNENKKSKNYGKWL
jgi:hypothetical protein